MFGTTPGWPWEDGIAMHPDHAALGGIGILNSISGWNRTADLVSRESLTCTANTNSSGFAAECFALGSTRVGAVDLELIVQGAVPDPFGAFFFGDATQPVPMGPVPMGPVPMGSANLCFAGNVDNLPPTMTDRRGESRILLDLASVVAPGTGFLVGSTWTFQFVFRDPGSAAGGVGASDGIQLLLQ